MITFLTGVATRTEIRRADVNAMAEDLIGQLELPQCECLNASSKHTLRDCIEVGLDCGRGPPA